MAFDEGLAQVFRDALIRTEGIIEKKMFGGLCFMLHGNMLCGVHQDGGMARVGKEAEANTLQIDGVTPLAFTGRPMGALSISGTTSSVMTIADSKFSNSHLNMCRACLPSERLISADATKVVAWARGRRSADGSGTSGVPLVVPPKKNDCVS